ncbi:MAG: alanine--glyoxylate aminotransferase family protein [Chloroflexi bacterium]|nr:alanine--glyoxylate aminotransferase family protein [Chloroflexota bacterium]
MTSVAHQELNPPQRILLGPGPSNVHPKVIQAMIAPMVGYMDPYFFQVMDETMELLRQVFKTGNEVTLPISGTGSAGMETAVCNVVEAGDTVVVGCHGFFGERIAEMASRCGARVVRVEAEWGRAIEPDAIEAALKGHARIKALALVHAETSTGVLQPLSEASRLAHEQDALFIVDAVTSLGGIDVDVDGLDIDICYSGTQKCLGCPPGLAPVTFSRRAMDVVQKRDTRVVNWYLDMSLIHSYWSSSRVYHHTPPAPMIYGLHQALRLILEEGLESRFQRHRANGSALQSGLETMGLTLHAQAGYRLSTLTSVRVPEGVDDVRVRRTLLDRFGIEIGGGLGPLKGRAWRIGLMGESSTARNVLLLLLALEAVLAEEGFKPRPGAAAAALQHLV